MQLAWSSITEWKYTNGLWRVAYWSAGVACWVLSTAPIAGWAQVAGLARRVGAHVLHVAAPGQPCLLELIGDGLDLRRIDASRAERLAAVADPGEGEFRERRAVGLGDGFSDWPLIIVR